MRTSATFFSRVPAALVALSLATAPLAPAFAQDAKPDKKTVDAARAAYAEGEKSFKAGEYASAYLGYKKANDTLPSPHAKFWMAMALDKQGDRQKEAFEAYSAFLADPGAERLGPERLEEARQRHAALAKSPGKLLLTTVPAGASVAVNGEAQMGESPFSLTLPGGTHRISVTAPDHDGQEIEVEVKPFGSVEATVTLTAKPAPAPAPPPSEEPPAEAPEPPAPKEAPSKVPAYVTLGLAGAGLVVGTIFGLQAMSAKSDFDEKPTSKKADDAERNALIADMAFGVAITLGVTGIVLLTSGDSAPEKEKTSKKSLPKKARFNVAPYATPSGGGAAARFVF